MSTSVALPPAATETLRTQLTGRVVLPADPGYDDARLVARRDLDAKPAVIVRVADEEDVIRAVTFARDHELPLAVRSGGHSAAGYGAVDDGLVIDLRDLKAVDIVPDARTVWVEAGVTAGELLEAAGPHGLGAALGDTRTVGVSGLTLGGGIGYLVRKHGLTIDHLLAADVVTADGHLRRADAGSHPDLFWALRGGGGNLGVVTRLQLRLIEIPQVTGGVLLVPATAEAVAGAVAATQSAPEELTSIVTVVTCPPLPFVPDAYHGQLVVMMQLCVLGDEAAGRGAVEPFRALGEPIVDMVRPMRYPELFPPPEPPSPLLAAVKTMFLESVGVAEAQRLIDHLQRCPAPVRAVQLRVLGGACARIPADATAYAHRERSIMANVAAFYPESADRDEPVAWVDAVMGDLHQGSDAAYVNFLGDEGPERVRAAYPGATWDRLAAVKAVYDPQNLFRVNQNVPPTTVPRQRS